VYANGTNPIENWYQADLSEDARWLFDKVIKDTRKIDNPMNWVDFRRHMKGQCKKYSIWEFGFYCDKRQYRILGIYGTSRKHAYLLVGCYHKERIYTPTNALESACTRASLLLRGEATINERPSRHDR
jgi:hypothetical protein